MVKYGELHNILRILIENQEEKFSIRKLSLVRNINYKTAYETISKLEKEGVVKLEKLGNTTNCSFSGKFNPLVFEAEYIRREKILINNNFKVIYSRLNSLNFPFILLLFGSFVNKKNNKNSDIDLLAISENEKDIKQAISLIPLNIHLTCINYDEFIKMAKSKEFSVVSEVIKKNIILIGIEEYYRILNNALKNG